jgi:hypothetical protein
MAQLSIPPDLGRAVAEDLRRHPGEAAAVDFIELVQAGVRWEPGRPRQLLAWLRKHSISLDIGPRALLCALAGFRDGAEDRLPRLRVAALALREARLAVENGSEWPEGYLPIWSMNDEPPRVDWDALRGAFDPMNPMGQTSRREQYPSPADGMGLRPPPSSPSAPSTPAPSPRPSRPAVPVADRVLGGCNGPARDVTRSESAGYRAGRPSLRKRRCGRFAGRRPWPGCRRVGVR